MRPLFWHTSIHTDAEAREHRFRRAEYRRQPAPDGEVTAVLDARIWRPGVGLGCYFSRSNGAKFQLTAVPLATGVYTPDDGGLDLAAPCITAGSEIRLQIGRRLRGRARWLSAEVTQPADCDLLPTGLDRYVGDWRRLLGLAWTPRIPDKSTARNAGFRPELYDCRSAYEGEWEGTLEMRIDTAGGIRCYFTHERGRRFSIRARYRSRPGTRESPDCRIHLASADVRIGERFVLDVGRSRDGSPCLMGAWRPGGEEPDRFAPAVPDLLAWELRGRLAEHRERVICERVSRRDGGLRGR